MSVRHWAWGCGLLLLAGCSRAPERPPGTGAKESVQSYYEALLHKNWSKAYSTLHPNSRSRLSADQFARLAQKYLSSLGFEPDAVHVRAWDEQGTEGTAHVVLTGQVAGKVHRYKDAITLQRSDDGWRVVLPPNFGRATGR
jgi:hypothetical protein